MKTLTMRSSVSDLEIWKSEKQLGRICKNLLTALTLAFGVAIFLAGCGGDSAESSSSNRIPVVSIPSSKPFPPEYRVLAQEISLEMKSDPSEFRDDKSAPEIISEGHTAIMALQGIKSADQDIMYIADQGQAAFSEAILHFERINALPKPPGEVALFVSSFIDGFFGNVYGGYARGIDAEEKQNAIIEEMHPLLAALEKAEAAQQMLLKVAEKYSATIGDSTGRIVVDFNESWGPVGPHDWFCIYNSGPVLRDCTILVELTGVRGELKKNVHFVQDWPAKTWMYGRYETGTKILEKTVGRATVVLVQKIDVTVYSQQFATSIAYTYQGAEKDKDIAKHCKNLEFTGHYQPFESGFIWDTQRGVEFRLDGVEWIPKCRVDVTFRNGSKTKAWFWELDNWVKGEKSFTPPKGGLTFDPTNIGMTISFTDTNYKHEVTLNVNR